MHDGLSLAKAYLDLPADFRNSVMIDFNTPDTRDASQTHPEQAAAKSDHPAGPPDPDDPHRAPALQRRTLNTCGDWLNGIPNNCGSVNQNRTATRARHLREAGSGWRFGLPYNALNAELNRLFGTR